VLCFVLFLFCLLPDRKLGAVVAAQLQCRDKELVVSALSELGSGALRLAWLLSDATRNHAFLYAVVAKTVHESVFVEEQRLLYRSIARLCTELKSPATKANLVELRKAGALMALQSKLAIDLCAMCKGENRA
jgi:hypothetical protein